MGVDSTMRGLRDRCDRGAFIAGDYWRAFTASKRMRSRTLPQGWESRLYSAMINTQFVACCGVTQATGADHPK